MSLFNKPAGGLNLGGGGSALFAKPGKAAPSDERDDESLEQHADRTLNEAQQAFRDRAKAEAKRFELATDSEYWTAVCFQSRAQKEQFLQALRDKFKLDDDGDKYLDGWELAKALGITLDREQVPYNTSGRIDKKWAGLVR